MIPGAPEMLVILFIIIFIVIPMYMIYRYGLMKGKLQSKKE